ncbi:MAG: hypothetical protein QXO94_00685, partial [Candidatus Bathyarchaeia archaeon]
MPGGGERLHLPFPSILTDTRISKHPYGYPDFQASLRIPGFPSILTDTRISKHPYGYPDFQAS